MFVRASVIFLINLICQLALSAFFIWLAFFSIDFKTILTECMSGIFSEHPFEIKMLSLVVICCLISSLLATISWAWFKEIHPTFGILAGIISYAIIAYAWFDQNNEISKSGVVSIYTFIPFCVIAIDWWLTKLFADIKSDRIGISLEKTDKKFLFAFLFNLGILVIAAIFIVLVLFLTVRLGIYHADAIKEYVNDSSFFIDSADNFGVNIYCIVAIITAIVLFFYTFFKLWCKPSLEMTQFTNCALITSCVFGFFALVASSSALDVIMDNTYYDFGDDNAGIAYVAMMCITVVCKVSVCLSFAFWLIRCVAGKFKSVG